MKKVVNKTTTAIVLAVTMLAALFCGLFFAKNSKTAFAAAPASISASTDKAEYFAGDTIKYTLTISTSDAGVYHSVVLRNAILSADGVTVDADNSKYFAFDIGTFSTSANTWDNAGTDGHPDDADFDQIVTNNAGALNFGLSKDGSAAGLTATESITMTIDITIDANTPLGEYTIGVPKAQADFVRTMNGATQVTHKTNDSALTTNSVATFKVTEASDNNNLSGLKIGQGDDDSKFTTVNLTDPGFDKTNIAITVTDPSLPLSVLPTTEDDGAEVVLKPGDVAVEGGNTGKVNIPADGVITVEVTAENGDKQEYKIKVTVVGASIDTLTVTTDTSTTGVTKDGLKDPFASATTAYTVYVPSDSNEVNFTATVSTGHHEQNELGLARTGACSVPTKATSGTAFAVTGIVDGDKITITAKASDGTTESTKDYVITFDVVDVDASLKSLKVVGVNTKKEMTNDTDLATANSVDYYYYVLGESAGETNLTVEANSSVVESISIDGSEYSAPATKKLGEGKYTVKIKAEAGNESSYTVMLKNKLSLKLKTTASVDFIRKNTVTNSEGEYNYIQSYKKATLTHGIDDIKWERIMIGNIRQGTSINDFLANFQADQLANINVYKHYGEKMVALGQPATGHTADELADGENNAVGTGWYVEYVVNGTVEETIYLSVLGDIDGNGVVTPYDISLLVGYVGLTDTSCLDNLENYMAAMFTNFGTISAGDIGEMANYIMGSETEYNRVLTTA